MDSELNEMIELAAHLHSARELALLQVRRLEHRDNKRLQKALERNRKPTTHETGYRQPA